MRDTMRVIIDPALILAVLASGCATSSPKRRNVAHAADPDEDALDPPQPDEDACKPRQEGA